MGRSLLINLSYLMERPTGISTYALGLLPQLRCLDPLVLSPRDLPGFRRQAISDQLSPEWGMRGHMRRLLWTQFHCPRIYLHQGGDLLFSPLPEAPLFSHCRSVVTLHDLIPAHFPEWRQKNRYYYRWYVPRVLHHAEHILCDSQATADDAIRFHRIPAQKLSVIPLACDTDRFQWLDLPRQNYFLYVGRDAPNKNLWRMIRALGQMQTRGSGVELWLAGGLKPDTLRDLNRWIDELDLGSQVKVVGYVDPEQLPVMINQAIAVLMPSLWEGFGLPVLEAMACGTPVITSEISSLPEVAGEAALLVDPYSVEAIAAAMDRVITDADLWRQLHELGLARVKQFSWSRTGEMTREILARFL